MYVEIIKTERYSSFTDARYVTSSLAFVVVLTMMQSSAISRLMYSKSRSVSYLLSFLIHI